MLAQQYLDRIETHNNVWCGGERVTSPSSHPALKDLVSFVGNYYQIIDEKPDVFGTQTDAGLAARSLAIPRSQECLSSKRVAYKKVADLSHGMLGRTPDFMNAAMVALSTNADKLGADKYANYASNAKVLYRECCTENFFMSHAAINPQIDRSKSLGALNNTYAGVKITQTRSDGILVSGAKMIVTLGPVADQMAVFNMPGLREGDEDFAVAFIIPSNTKGVRFLCRNTTLRPEQSAFDRPLANAFDEMDALVVLEDVFVPWDRILIYRDVAKSNAFFDGMRLRHHTGHQGIVRGLAKMEFVGGVAIKAADMLGLNSFLPIQQKLGELTSYVELTRAIIHNTEATATQDTKGVLHPNSGPIQALRLQFPKWYSTAVETIQSLCAGSMMSVPNQADFFNENAQSLERIFGKDGMSAKERFALLNLAWDLTGTDFGQRQLAYECFHSGDPMRIAAGHLHSFDKTTMMSSVDRALEAAL